MAWRVSVGPSRAGGLTLILGTQSGTDSVGRLTPALWRVCRPHFGVAVCSRPSDAAGRADVGGPKGVPMDRVICRAHWGRCLAVVVALAFSLIVEDHNVAPEISRLPGKRAPTPSGVQPQASCGG
jgi:hypothetical protein